jgi:hypothetical protein
VVYIMALSRYFRVKSPQLPIHSFKFSCNRQFCSFRNWVVRSQSDLSLRFNLFGRNAL